MNDQELTEHINGLVAEEHRLLDRVGAMTADERRRLDDLNVQLDRLWDLLRQRRAREEFKQDPDTATERSGQTVERYLQ